MGTNFRKLYRKKRKEKEQRQEEESCVSKPVTKEINMASKASGTTLEKPTLPLPPSNQSTPKDETPTPLLDLVRAKHALGRIDTLKANALKGIEYGNYVSYVEGLPAAILQNGLGQTMATLLAGANLTEKDQNKRKPDEKARETLYQHIGSWLCRNETDAPYAAKPDLMHAITQGDEDTYLRAQAEALAYLRWLKKFAVAFLKKAGTTNASALQ